MRYGVRWRASARVPTRHAESAAESLRHCSLHVGDFAVFEGDLHVFIDIDLLGAEYYGLDRLPQGGFDLIDSLAGTDIDLLHGFRSWREAGFGFGAVGFLGLLVDLRGDFALGR